MKKLIGLLLLLCFLHGQSIAQQAKLSLKEQRAFDLLKVSLFASNKFGPVYLDHHQYNFERDDQGDLIITVATAPNTPDQLMGDKYAYYKISNRNDVPYLIEMHYECKRQGFIRIDKWDGNKIPKSAGRGSDSGDLRYDAQDRIVAIDLGRSYRSKGKKKVYMDKLLNFKYNEQGQLSEVAREMVVYKKSKANKNLKKDYTYKEFNVKVIYGADKITLIKEGFRYFKGKQMKSDYIEYELSRQGSQTVEVQNNTSYNKKGEQTTITTITRDYDEQSRLIQSQKKTPNFTRTDTYSYNDQGYVSKEESLQESSNYPNKKEITTYQYDALGLPSETTREEFKDGVFSKKIVTSYTYKAPKDGETLTKCNNKKDYLAKHYNAAGEVYQESIPSKLREKKNGVWGPWKFYQM